MWNDIDTSNILETVFANLSTANMRGSRNFRQGRVQVSLSKKALTFFLFFF